MKEFFFSSDWIKFVSNNYKFNISNIFKNMKNKLRLRPVREPRKTFEDSCIFQRIIYDVTNACK